MRLKTRPYLRLWLGLPGELPPKLPPGLLEEAEQEGVAGLVAAVLQAQGVAPPGFREISLSYFREGARHMAGLEALAEALVEQGLEVVALKGAALIPTVYGGQYSCRPLSDLDLLVRPQEELSIRELPRASVTMDWHLHLVDLDRLPAKQALCRLSPEELWSLTRPWRPGVRHLTPELQFIHLALHAFKHSCCRLLWMVDLALVLRTCRAHELQALADRVGARRPVALAVALVERLWGESLAGLSPRLRWYERFLLELLSRGYGSGPWGELFLIASVRGFGQRLAYLRDYLFREGNLGRWGRFLRSPDRTRGHA